MLKLKCDCYCRTFSNFAIEFDRSAVIGYGVLYDGKSETGATGFFGMAFIYTVETFKDATMMFSRNTDAGIADRKDDIAVLVLEINRHLAAVLVIADSVITKVVDDLVKVSADAVHHAGLSI